MSTKPIFKYSHVLLIDDKPLDNFINKKTIELFHFSKVISVSTSAGSAVEFLQNLVALAEGGTQVYPEVIFVDINMPVTDGFQFIGTFKEAIEKYLPGAKLVILTSSVSESDRQKARAIAGNIQFYHKPLTEEILNRI